MLAAGALLPLFGRMLAAGAPLPLHACWKIAEHLWLTCVAIFALAASCCRSQRRPILAAVKGSRRCMLAAGALLPLQPTGRMLTAAAAAPPVRGAPFASGAPRPQHHTGGTLVSAALYTTGRMLAAGALLPAGAFLSLHPTGGMLAAAAAAAAASPVRGAPFSSGAPRTQHLAGGGLATGRMRC